MPNVTLPQAKALSAVPCPNAAHDGWIADSKPCTQCDGRGTLAYPSEWPQDVYVDWPDSLVGLGTPPELEKWASEAESIYYGRDDRPFYATWWAPAPDAIRALMWLESVGAIQWGKRLPEPMGHNWHWLIPGWGGSAADTPEALLDAVLAALTRTPSANL